MKENYDKICEVVEEVDNKPNFIKGKFYVQKINTIYCFETLTSNTIYTIIDFADTKIVKK